MSESEFIEQPKIKRKLPELPWGSLPEQYRLGQNFNDEMTLFRGDVLEKLSGDIRPTATEQEIFEFLDQISNELKKGPSAGILHLINPHLTYAHKEGVHTPFISASTSFVFARNNFATGGLASEKGVATLQVPVNRLVAFRHHLQDEAPFEVLIFGGVLHEEITKIDVV